MAESIYMSIYVVDINQGMFLFLSGSMTEWIIIHLILHFFTHIVFIV